MPIRIGIQSPSHILCAGIKVIIENTPDLELVAKSLTKRTFKKLIKKTTPDMVFLDTAMMTQSAIEIMAIKYKKNWPDMKIVLISNKKTLGRKELTTLIDIGVNGYLFRKTVPGNIIDAINAVKNENRYLNGHIVSLSFRPVSETLHKRIPNKKDIKPLDSKQQEAIDSFLLTSREKDILCAMLANENYTDDDIGEMFGISIKTVKNCRVKIMKKLGVKNRLSLYKFAIKNGLLSIENFLRDK